MKKILCGIVLYNADVQRLFEGIESVLSQVERVCIYDNGSENIDIIETRLERYNHVVLIKDKKNNGIGYALNRIFEYAHNEKFDWVLTLDHDTICPPNMISVYQKYIQIKNVGILCPNVIDKEIVKNIWGGESKIAIEKVNRCIQSGALVKIQAWRECKGFDEWMFVDFVDFDFCTRMSINKYQIFRCNQVVIDHQLGAREKSRFVNFYIKLYNFTHLSIFKYMSYQNVFSPSRVYYTARNNLVYIYKYKKYINSNKEKVDFYIRILKKLLRAKNKRMIIKETRRGIADAQIEIDKMKNNKI